MSGFSRGSNLAAYQSAAAHGGVAAADPHRLIVMLLDGAIERLASCRGCIQRGELAEKARLLDRVLLIINELHSSLDMTKGGQIATNLSDLYHHMTHKLLQGSMRNSIEDLEEVSGLLRQIRDAWVQVPVRLGGGLR